ncbi:MAG: hypothetical protein KF691_05085 [Phycisphaeraceae bacterium]|nr:hypothetical protein [Phycisphaeraceae bacterium]
MNVVLSPYHLTTKEPPAMAALLLAERVVTFIPSPLSGSDRESLGRAVTMSPGYLRFMDSWRWSTPLWESGVVCSAFRDTDASGDIHHVFGALANDDRFTPLRALLHEDLFDDEKRYLDAVSHDLLKGGPDPGVSLPMSAALDRFACRNSLMVMRAHPTSVAQRAEEKLCRRVVTIAIPGVVQADARRLMIYRKELHEPLSELREALSGAVRDLYRDSAEPLDRDSLAEIEHAARAYSMEFDALREDMASDAGDDEVRLIDATMTLSLTAAPVDAVLRSGLTAMRVLTGVPRKELSGRHQPESGVAALARRDALEGRSVITLVVKPLGRPNASKR